MNIRPISDLRNNFTSIENSVKAGEPVILTKNGYGSMVVMDIDQYSVLVDPIESKLHQADLVAERDSIRYTSDEIFSKLRGRINGKETV